MKKGTLRTIAIVMATAITVAGAAPADTADAARIDVNRWTKQQLWDRATAVLPPSREERLGPDKYGREWDFSAEDRGNFTLFDKVKDVRVTDEGALAFTLTDETGTLGWGNVGGKQPIKDRVAFWPRFNVRMNVRQSRDAETGVKLRFWSQGQRDRERGGSYHHGHHIKTLTGTEWTELTFRTWLEPPPRDGFDIEFRGPAGNTVEIKDLAITHYDVQGFLRKEIDLPDGDVWKALAEVGYVNRLTVNGVLVKLARVPGGGGPGYGSETVDLKPFLKAGQVNCIGLYARRTGESPTMKPLIAMQGSVIMNSGDRYTLDTDTSWTWSADPGEGWDKPGFDDSGWRRVKADSEDEADAVLAPGWQLHYRSSRLPVYDGLLRLVNPHDTQLYYTDTKPVVCRVEIPRGLEEQSPVLAWSISRYTDGALSQAASGTVEAATAAGTSLQYQINAGRLGRGVYLLKTALFAGGKTLAERPPEALMVTGRLPMPVTEGDTYTQGMDLALEREIDFTDPADGPWAEAAGGKQASEPVMDPDAGVSEATIVERNGLTYRETQPNYCAVLSYLVQFEHPSDFYLMELDYPNDMRRKMGMACSPATWGMTRGHSKSSATVVTGGRYPISGDMQTLRWVYRPDPGNHSLNLVNLMPDTPAAAAALRIYRIRNGLPELRSPRTHSRSIGLLTERTKDEQGRFAVREEPLGSRRDARRQADAKLVALKCKELEFFLDGCEAFARYMRFAGQNVHMMGSFQYSPHNPPSPVFDWPFPYARLRGGIRDVLGRVLRDNDIDFYAHVEFIHTPELRAIGREAADRPETGFWDTPYIVDRYGKAHISNAGRYGFNFNHPKVRKTMLETAEQIGRKYRSLSNFKGLLWNTFVGDSWLPTYRQRLHRGPWTKEEFTHFGYGDVMIREFEQDTEQDVPFTLDDPDRFSKRHQFLNADAMRATWLSWRAQRMHGFFHDVAARLRDIREDLICAAHAYLVPRLDLEWRQSGMSFHDYMLANGWDGSLFDKDDTVCLSTSFWGVMNRIDDPRRSGVGWDMSGSRERYDFFEATTHRPVEIKHSWKEAEKRSWCLPYREGWPRQFQLTLMYQSDGDYAREVFTRTLIGSDPDIFFYGFSDATLFEGNEQPMRDFSRVLRSLPTQKFMPVADTWLDTNLAIRDLSLDATYWFYVANPGYWPVRGELTVDNADAVQDAVTGATVAKSGWLGNNVKVNLALEPFGVAAFKTASTQAKVTAWSAQPEQGKGVEHLRGVITRTEELLKNPAALVTLRPGEQKSMREITAAARKALERGEYAAALLTVSSDRFWLLKNEYLEKGARHITDGMLEKGIEVTTEQKTAEAVSTDEPPFLDAKPDDPVWGDAEVCGNFASSDRMPAMAPTEFQAAHDGRHLYLFIRCADRNPDEIKMDAKQERDIWREKDDAVSIFIQPDADTAVYYQLAITAGGVKFDQRVNAGAKDYASFAPSWDVVTAVTDEGWNAEVKLPATALDAKIGEGETWRFNVHRAFRKGKVPPSSWSYSPASWHDVERLGVLEFE